jgi:hypothetical protein
MTDNTTDKLRSALRQLPAPEPGTDLLQRVLRTREMGAQVFLPARRPLPWRPAVAAAVAALVVGGLLLWPSGTVVRDTTVVHADPLGELFRGTMLWPSAGGAQEVLGATPAPQYPLISSASLQPARLTGGTWSYSSTTTIDDILTEPSFIDGIRIRMSRATYDGRPAWSLNIARRFRQGPWGDYSDTTFIDAASLRPLYAVGYGYKHRTRIVQTFSSESGSQSIDITGPMRGHLEGVMTLPFPPTAVFTNSWSLSPFRVLLPAIPLARNWRGSMYQTGLFSKSGPGTLVQHAAPVDLRVVGRGSVTVPAGTFDCWRVEMESHIREPERWSIWVTRDRGWVVKVQLRWSDYITNEVLESYEPLP